MYSALKLLPVFWIKIYSWTN